MKMTQWTLLVSHIAQSLVVLAFTVPSTLVAQDTRAGSEDRHLLGQPINSYQERRSILMERVKESAEHGLSSEGEFGRFSPPRSREPIVILRGADSPDLESKFRQSNDFAYLTGVDVPSAVLVLYPNRGESILYLAPSEGHGDPLSAALIGPGPEAVERFGFERVRSTEMLLGDVLTAVGDPLVRTARGSGAILYVPDPNGHDVDGPERRLIQLLKQAAPNTQFRDVAPIIHAMRKVKSEAELVLLQKAIDITGTAQRAVMESIRPGIVEYELEGIILGAFVGGGALRPGFPSIVGSGPNATIPHYFANDRRTEPGDLVVVDIGAEYKNYTADITRTFPINGTFTPRQRELYELVLNAQKAVEAEMKPGETRLSEMTGFVRRFFDESPLRARDEHAQEHSLGHFFIHGLGHYLGMDVHDVGGYSAPVQVGEVFTIEPGLYIPSENLGIRIEDDYIMTPDGPKKLSSTIPSDPVEIESIMTRARGNREVQAASAAHLPPEGDADR